MRALQGKFLLMVIVPLQAPLCQPWAARDLPQGEGLVQPGTSARSWAWRLLWGRAFAASAQLLLHAAARQKILTDFFLQISLFMAQLLLAPSVLGRHVGWHMFTWEPGLGLCGVLCRLQYVLFQSDMGHRFASPLWAAAPTLLVVRSKGQRWRIPNQALQLDHCASPMCL